MKRALNLNQSKRLPTNSKTQTMRNSFANSSLGEKKASPPFKAMVPKSSQTVLTDMARSATGFKAAIS